MVEQEEPEEQTDQRGLALTLRVRVNSRRSPRPHGKRRVWEPTTVSTCVLKFRIVGQVNGPWLRRRAPGVRIDNELRTVRRVVVSPQILELEGLWTFFRFLLLGSLHRFCRGMQLVRRRLGAGVDQEAVRGKGLI